MPTIIKEYAYLTNDLAFKQVFCKSKILVDFINSFQEYLNITPNLKFESILAQKYIAPNNKRNKAFYSDIVGTIASGNIIFLEMYSNNFTIRNYKKSLSYLCILYSEQIKKGDYKYENIHKVIGINLIKGNFYKNTELVNEYEFANKITYKTVLDGDIEMYIVKLDKVEEIGYTKEEKRFIKWLKLINSKNLQEMKEIAKGDERMENSIRVLEEWNEERSEDAMERYYGEKMLEKEELGISKSKNDIAIKMLKDTVEIPIIAKYTGLSRKEIKALQNNLS